MATITANAFLTENAPLVRDTALKAQEAQSAESGGGLTILLINTKDPTMASIAAAWSLPKREDGVLCAAISNRSAAQLLGTLGLPTDSEPSKPGAVQVCTLASAESVTIGFLDLGDE